MTFVKTDFRLRSHQLTPWVSTAVLVILAVLLRFYRLEGQIWLDEIAALTGNYRKPFWEILTKFPGFFPHPLYELLAHSSLVLFGESAWAIRLPAALFGIAGVLIFYRLARRFSGPGEAFLAGVLLAVSYHHIFFSQNARGYTVFLFFALAATDFLLMLLENMRWRTALIYVAVAALTTYAQPFGIFVPVGHILVALPVVWARRRKGDRSVPTVAQLFGIVVLTNLAILMLYAPLIRDSVAFSLTTARTADHGPRVLALLPELLEGLRAAFSGWSGLILATAVGTLGILDFLRRHSVALGVMVFPLLVSASAVGVLDAGIHARYFLLALPIGYLVGTRGLVVVARTALERVMQLPAAFTTKAQGALAVLMVILATIPLHRYYTVPKQDYLGALRQVETLAAEEDRTVAVALAAHAIRAYYIPDYPMVENLPELLQEEASGQRVWVVTTLERVEAKRDPELLAHIRQNYKLVKVLPGSLGDGAMRIYMREATSSQSPQRSSNGEIARQLP
jgi:uncharacterized membrane protein